MGTLDDLTNSFGPDALKPRPGSGRGAPSWHGLCVCGHLQRFHSTDVDGTFRMREGFESTFPDGSRMVTSHVFHGCRGSMVSKGQETVTEVKDETADPMTTVVTFLATCPCPEFREIAKVDRPNRYFNQRVPTDWEDPLRHPLIIGIRAFNTFLSHRRRALSDPTWAAAEFDRRFEWTHRRCALSRCEVAGDGVWPVYLNPEMDIELRCAAHR